VVVVSSKKKIKNKTSKCKLMKEEIYQRSPSYMGERRAMMSYVWRFYTVAASAI
jgi:tRNA U54 and U55 pseudouridine synthase Pus10